MSTAAWTRQRVEQLAPDASSGVQCIALLALSDEGAPAFDAQLAASLVSLGVPAFACTPDRFPELLAAAIGRDDLRQWHTQQG